MKDLITTVIATEVLTKIVGLQRFNEITETHIFTSENNMKIVVKYLDYHVDLEGNRFDIKNSFYSITPNPNGLPLVAPEDDIEAEIFDASTDEYFMWLNGQVGGDISTGIISKLTTINGAPS